MKKDLNATDPKTPMNSAKDIVRGFVIALVSLIVGLGMGYLLSLRPRDYVDEEFALVAFPTIFAMLTTIGAPTIRHLVGAIACLAITVTALYLWRKIEGHESAFYIDGVDALLIFVIGIAVALVIKALISPWPSRGREPQASVATERKHGPVRNLTAEEREHVDRDPTSVKVQDWNSTEITHASAAIAYLMNANRVADASEIVRANWPIVRHMPSDYCDNEQLMLAAMSQELAAGNEASDRLKADFEFFLAAFSKRNGVAMDSARDALFWLEFARSCHNYRHAIAEQTVLARYGISPDDGWKTVASAHTLVGLCKSDHHWIKDDEQSSIEYLEHACPGFARATYRQAYRWACAAYGSVLAPTRPEWL